MVGWSAAKRQARDQSEAETKAMEQQGTILRFTILPTGGTSHALTSHAHTSPSPTQTHTLTHTRTLPHTRSHSHANTQC